MRNITVSNASVGIYQIWSWGFQYQGVNINNCSIAFAMTNGGAGNSQQVGSINIIDSNIQNCPIFLDTSWQNTTQSKGNLILENIGLSNVPIAVRDNGATVLQGTGSGASTTISGWGQGHAYTPTGPNSFQGPITPVKRPQGLLASGSSNYYTRSKPQYESLPTSSFVSVRTAGAKGDGKTDDTSAINSVLQTAASSGKIVFFDQGSYKVSGTIYIPPGSKIVGESYPVIMGSGSTFANMAQPVPVVQVGKPGDAGSVEWSDMVVSTQGSAPGAILIEWNLAASQGSGMWDVHTRVGGYSGSQLQVAQCPTGAAVSVTCEAAFMSMHITPSANNVYLENVWLWTADHDLDDPNNTQISVYTGRGLLVEAKNLWLYVQLIRTDPAES